MKAEESVATTAAPTAVATRAAKTLLRSERGSAFLLGLSPTRAA
jgi:hypothetical protein